MDQIQKFQPNYTVKASESLSFSLVHKNQIPLYFLNIKKSREKATILAADVGGTKTDLALFQMENAKMTIIKEKSYSTKMHNSFMEMVRQFLISDSPVIDSICMGVAGPITQGKVHGTNFPWDIDLEEIQKSLKIPSVSLINDMQANAYGLAALQEKDFDTIKYGANIPGNMALISPGTGLGEAGLFWDGTHYHPFATEGSHCDFSPRNDLDIEIWHYFQHKYGHVSWERLVSGPGILDIYLLLRRVSEEKEPKWLQEELEKRDSSRVITETALKGKDSVCRETLDLFIRYLAIETAQLALKFKATGGVYMGGGILPKIIKGINREIFCSNFLQSGRMNSLLQMVPVKVLLNEKTALLGAAYYAAKKIHQESIP